MKFDSYSRFLKSDLYNKCLTQDRKGLSLPFVGDDPDLEMSSENNFTKVSDLPITGRITNVTTMLFDRKQSLKQKKGDANLCFLGIEKIEVKAKIEEKPNTGSEKSLASVPLLNLRALVQNSPIVGLL